MQNEGKSMRQNARDVGGIPPAKMRQGASREEEKKYNEHIITMLKESMRDEKTDVDYYAQMMEEMVSEGDKEIIRDIRNDEIKHYKLLQEVYYELVGDKTEVKAGKKSITGHVLRDIENSLFAELDAVANYRKLYFSFLTLSIRDIFFEIMSDEQIHATKLSYLYAKYK